MATLDDFNTLIAAFNEDTNAIADVISKLNATIAAGAAGAGLTQQQSVDILAKLQPIETKLKALGANPANPVPGTPVTVPTA